MSTLAELREALSKATPGPWEWRHDHQWQGSLYVVVAPGQLPVPQLWMTVAPYVLWENATLIVLLRNHAEALLDVAEAAREVVREIGQPDVRYIEPIESASEALRAALARLEAEK